MIKNLKKTGILLLTLVVFSSCVKDDDFAIPRVVELILNETFEGTTNGSGANEIAIALDGWVNHATVGSRKWHSRLFSNNKYAEFSSFYSVVATDPNDEVWLITPALDFTTTNNEALSFDSKVRFYEGEVVTVFVSEDYDGTVAGITTATWTQLSPVLPNASQVDAFINSGVLDLSMYNSNNVRVAFKYTGSRQTNVTTTFQLDNIKIFEN